MDIKVTQAEGRVPVTVVQVDGNIDASSYEKFQQMMEDLIAKGARYLLIDLSHSPFVSSAGLRALHTVFNQLRGTDPNNSARDEEVRKGINTGTYKSPNLKLLNPSKETRTVFQLSGFDMFIDTFDNRDEALSSFQAAD
jgi:anti-anti-sigma factor